LDRVSDYGSEGWGFDSSWARHFISFIQKEANTFQLISMTKKYKEMKLLSDDIVCLSCVEDMENILRETIGIVDASVNYNENTILVRYDPELIDRKEVYVAVRKLGSVKKILSES
jgi:copper chaperone CopZ